MAGLRFDTLGRWQRRRWRSHRRPPAVDGAAELRAGVAKPLRWPPRPCLPVRSQDRIAQECRGRSGGMSAGNPSSDAAGAGALTRLGYWLDQPKVLAWLMLGPAVLYVIA